MNEVQKVFIYLLQMKKCLEKMTEKEIQIKLTALNEVFTKAKETGMNKALEEWLSGQITFLEDLLSPVNSI